MSNLFFRLGAPALALSVSGAAIAAADSEGHGHEPLHRRNNPIKVALVGDTPYGDQNIEKYDRVIDDINASKAKFVLHVGDIKGGSSECSDERLQARFDQNERYAVPFVYTPGDNEWTDCHRVAAGMYNPNERLDRIRELFFPVPGMTTGGRRMQVQTQASDSAYATFVENVRFIAGDVLFVTVHVVGSNNGLAPWSGIGEDPESPIQERLDEVAAREAAALAWLADSFDMAEDRGVSGVLIAIHANPGFDAPNTGFQAFLLALEQEVAAFERPVALVHGDSHYFREDKPLFADTVADGRRRLENFTRVESFGSADVHWVEIEIDPRSANVFEFSQRTVPENRFPR